MIQHQNIYFPDGEHHMVEWMTQSGEIVDGTGTYQIKKFRAAMGYITQGFRTAVDIGGHVGMWSMQLAKRFKQIHAFEPVAAHRDCFLKNNAGTSNIRLHDCALGAENGFVSIFSTPHSSGNSYVDFRGRAAPVATTQSRDKPIALKRLDEFALEDVDFIKIDCEGYELYGLKGGEETILRCRPVIIVEQKPGKAEQFGLPRTEAVTYLQTLGYDVKQDLSGDFIMVYGS